MVSSHASPREYLIPPPADPAAVPVATHYRGTWVTSSLASLRERKLFDVYLKHLPIALRDEVLFLPAMSWAKGEVVEAHYEACDKLGLTADAAVEMGVSATHRLKTATVVLGYSLAASTGITPWTLLERLDKVWNRGSNGGAVSVSVIGPKEAHIGVYGFPLCRIAYIRHGLRGVVRGALEPFARNIYVQEVGGRRREHSVNYKVQWV